MDDADRDALAELRAQALLSRTQPAPFFVVENFLPNDVHDLVLDGLIGLESEFWSNRTAGRDALALVNPQPVGPVIAEMKRRFDEILAVLSAQGAPVNDIHGCHMEPPAVSASGHANFHAPHIDNDPLSGVDAVFTRRISLVWHAFRQPQSFTGGGLRLWDHSEVASEHGPWTPASTWNDHPCNDNTLVAFSSYSLHEVLPVQMFEGPFADRRFAVVTAAHAS
jgi:hypothetical protein